ncbi:MAG: ABC transporter ATP-binding protein [Chloroflexi bacterium]|nr:ABC transporter ATP-binding protein [Chloroflexota bacterium]
MQLGLRIEGITLGYNGKDVVNGVSLAAMPGELLGLVGPNGCGKSTLIRGISHVLQPRSGHVTVEGKDITSLRRQELARLIGVVPQNPYLPQAFTVLELVLMGRTPYLSRFGSEAPRDIKIAWQAMETTGVHGLAERRIGELSGGERQRVVVARALAQEPKIMLLDEPTASLDINYQVQIMDMVSKLCHEHMLVVLIALHDLNLAAQYCDRLLMLHQGKIRFNGPPASVITRESIRSVYGVDVYVSSHPLNQLPTTFVVAGAGSSPDTIEKV